MTQLENFERLSRGDRPEWLPLDLTATPPIFDLVEKQRGTRDLTAAFDLDFARLEPDLAEDAAPWIRAYAGLGIQLPANAELDFAGTVWLKPEAGSTGNAYHLREMMHPLAGLTESKSLETLPWPDMADPKKYRHLAAQVRSAHAAGKATLVSMECTVFEFAWYLRGMDNLFSDLFERNDIGNSLLDWFTQRSILCGTACAKAGVDVIGLGDDIGMQHGMMMSLPFWREHIKPRLKKVIHAIRTAQPARKVQIRYHSDGDIRNAIDDLIEIGVDFLNPVQPECMPVAEVVRKYQDRLAFWGLIGTQTTMPFGSTDDVRSAVSECALLAREGARIVVAPTHVLEPDVPWANIETLVNCVRSERL